jgi:carboxyl-terminal processing protease
MHPVHLLAATVLSALALLATAAPLDSKRSLADFDAVWTAVERGYAYHDARHAAWKRARAVWRPRARVATSAELASILDQALAELHDENVAVVDRAPGAPRRFPEDADIRARWRGEAAVIDSVRISGDADVAGLKPGDLVFSVDGVPIGRAVSERLRGSEPTPGARNWALHNVLAGPRAGEMRIEVSTKGAHRMAVVERRGAAPTASPPILARRVGDARDVGYLRVRAMLPDANLLGEFDAALDSLADTRGLILDLREVGGRATSHETTVGILGRFTSAPAPWQVRESVRGARMTDSVSPRGTAYTAPVVVLVDAWTAGEGEALAAGLKAVAKARLVGTPMAGLRGELTEFRAPNSGLTVRFPAQRALLPDATPRETLVPAVAVDLAQPQVGSGDPILYQGLRLFQ